jgi:hypothetical protein
MMAVPKAEVSPKEAAVLVGRDVSRIYAWMREGKLPFRLEEGKNRIITADLLRVEAEIFVRVGQREEGMTDIDLTPTEGVDRVVPIVDCPVGAEVLIMVDGSHLFGHVCDRRPSNPNRSARFRANAGVIRCAPSLDPAGHVIVTVDPLTVSPSILCLDCGLHGFIRDGRWISA